MCKKVFYVTIHLTGTILLNRDVLFSMSKVSKAFIVPKVKHFALADPGFDLSGSGGGGIRKS